MTPAASRQSDNTETNSCERICGSANGMTCLTAFLGWKSGRQLAISRAQTSKRHNTGTCMKRRTFLLSAAATLAAPAIRAQAAWPTGQPIRVIEPYPAGAANDAMGRLAAQRLPAKFGATVVG